MAAPAEGYDPRDPIFKGCTRPAMILGVPVLPLTVVCGAVILIAIWTWFSLVFLTVPIVITMRQIAKSDDQQFRLLGLKMMFRCIYFNHNGRFWKASAYSPIAFKKR
jgi:type IV secretion system protein VirB3